MTHTFPLLLPATVETNLVETTLYYFPYTANGDYNTPFTLSLVQEYCCLDKLSFWPTARKKQEQSVLPVQVSPFPLPFVHENSNFLIQLPFLTSYNNNDDNSFISYAYPS